MFKRILPALGLLVLAPLVGEYLLGNIAIDALPMIIGLIPLYGGGALLIREVARRWRLGWPGIILLGLAYAVIEEGLLTQSLFDPDYVGLRLLDYGFIPALGIGAYWTVFVLAIHGVWSIAVPISIVEAGSRRPDTPWLGKVGLTVSAVLFLLGGAVPIALAGPAVYPLSAAQITWTMITAWALPVWSPTRGTASLSRRVFQRPRMWTSWATRSSRWPPSGCSPLWRYGSAAPLRQLDL